MQKSDKPSDKPAPEFEAAITPEQVKEKLANDKHPPKKTLPPAEKKPKAEKTKRENKGEAVEFPLSARINDYGFLGLRKGWLEALGWKKGMPLKIDKNEDGSVTIRKA